MRSVWIACGVLTVTAAAGAAPVLTWETATYGGSDVFTLSVQGDAGPAGWNLDITLTGTFRQNLAGGTTHVDTKSDAVLKDADPNFGYEMSDDCWYDDGFWVEVAPDSSDLTGSTTITLSSLGSIPGTTFDATVVGQFAVQAGTPVQWSGTLSYNGQDHAVAGSTSAPPRVTLTLTETNPTYGEVIVEPEQPDPNDLQFHEGTAIALTAVPVESKEFRNWEVYDPNYPGDANHASIDTNATLAFVISDDAHVNAVWGCGGGAAMMLPIPLAALALLLLKRTGRPGLDDPR